MDYLSTAYEEVKPLPHDLSKVDSRHYTAKHIHYTILMQSQLCWAGHVVCIKDHRLLKKLLYGDLSQSKPYNGDQKKHFKDTLKVSMKSFGITPNSLEYLAQDRDKWYEAVKRGAKVSEASRNAVTELHRMLRKGTATSASAVTIPYSHCPRLFHAQIGLISHLRTHGSRPKSYVDQMVIIDYDGQ